MDENTEFSLKTICCTCLSRNRQLVHLCKVKDGVNDLYVLLSSNSEAYEELFYRDSASLSMCWECRAIMRRISDFRRQACAVQKQLTGIMDGRTDENSSICLSHLSSYYKSDYNAIYISTMPGKSTDDIFASLDTGQGRCKETYTISELFKANQCEISVNNTNDGTIERKTNKADTLNEKIKTVESDNFVNCNPTTSSQNITTAFDNFVDCDPTDIEIKSELDEEDVPLAELNVDHFEDSETNTSRTAKTERKNKIYILKTDVNTSRLSRKTNKRSKLKKIQKESKTTKISKEDEEHYKINIMNEQEMLQSRDQRALSVNFLDAKIKCESCIEVFKEQSDLNSHINILHTLKNKHTQCDLCLCYIRPTALKEHRDTHYVQYNCKLCEYVAYCSNDIVKHLKIGHSVKKLSATVKWKKGLRKTPKVMNPGSKPRMNPVMKDKRTPYGYQCTGCTKYFETKRQRWLHIMRVHKEGFRCSFCGKRFAFKYNLIKHEKLHSTPLPREECTICHKSIRVDLAKTHAATHVKRESHSCVACAKSFASRASYYHHLKYTQAHAPIEDILKYKCSQCEKGYRSRAELRDHENYQHKGETQHKCPICHKALATVRCVRRHVRRAHEGIKENKKDKICQQCGKAFRDKKTLREHELTHTGERPLTCTECGNTFRQYASLYTHRKRVHKIHAPRKLVIGSTEVRSLEDGMRVETTSAETT